MSDNNTLISPGVYTDLDIEKYHSVEGVSRSGLIEFNKTPFHYWNKYLNPERPASEPTEAMIFGNAFHTFILEPHLFDSRYCIEPEHTLLKDFVEMYGKDNGRLLFDKQKDDYANFLLKSASKQVLTHKQIETLSFMKQSLENHPQAMDLIIGGRIEHSLFWIEPHTGTLCKTRPDVWHDGFTADLKTIAAADERSFVKALIAHGYHIQAAMNREGIRENTGKDIKSHTFVCVEKTFPYPVAIYILDITALEFAHVKFKKLVTDFAECKYNNVWNGYETKTIFLPEWAENL